jgi:hypothetical protein
MVIPIQIKKTLQIFIYLFKFFLANLNIFHDKVSYTVLSSTVGTVTVQYTRL